MAIKDLYNDPDSFKYNSKGNKYTKDIRGGGSSGQPFIKAPVPDTIDQLNNLTTEALSLDYPIRGGSYEELAARTDFARIDRFLLSYPQGKAFLDKQNGLNASNPLMESRQQGGRPNTMQYSDGRNLMKQIAEGGTGFRYPQAGLNENELGYIENTYQYVVSHKPKDRNRLVALYNFKVNPNPVDEFTGGTIAKELGINDTIDSELFFYQGGPGSLYGLGSTTIRTATDAKNQPLLSKNAPKYIGPYYQTNLDNIDVQARPQVEYQYFSTLGASRIYQLGDTLIGVDRDNQIQNTYQQSSEDFIRANQVPNVDTTIQYDQLKYTMGYNALVNRASVKPGDMAVSDFRQDVLDPSSVNKRDYSSIDVNIATRVGIGNPGARKDRSNTNTPFTSGQDKVNMYPIKTLSKSVGIDEFSVIGGNRDLIKFAFETVSNNNPELSRAMFFRAFLTGYNDSHEAQWDSKRYAGRGENFYTYQGFDRTVSFNFKVAAQSKQEMRYLYSKVNYLFSTLYPEYSGEGFMKGNFTKLTVGDLFVRTPGILTSLNLTVDDQYAWEIAMNEPEGGSDSDMLETPQLMDIAVNFKPILRHLPQNGRLSPIILTGNSQLSRQYLGAS